MRNTNLHLIIYIAAAILSLGALPAQAKGTTGSGGTTINEHFSAKKEQADKKLSHANKKLSNEDKKLSNKDKKLSNDGERPSRQFWEGIIAEVLEDSEEQALSGEDIHEALCELEETPINLNSATKEELERIPFLSDKDVADILEYIYRNGEMLSTAELSMIPTLDLWKTRILPCFIVIRSHTKEHKPTLATMLKHSKSSLMLTAGIPFYNRKGDDNGYLGYKYKHSLRYELSYSNHLRAGFLGAQDAGEPFFSGKNKTGYDFYSFYISLQKMGRLTNLTLGRYRVRMGMGLIMNSDMSLGKTITLTSLERQGTTIRPHSSRSQGKYLQGAAATVVISKSVSASAFVSYRKIDATLNTDSSSIATILTTGYHRTETEMQKKDNASQFASGASINYSQGGLAFGLSGIYASLDKPLAPKTEQTYRRYYASGQRFYNLSADYGITRGRFSLRGEVATGDCHAWATFNALSLRASSTLSLKAVYRYYSYRYYSLFSQSFSDGGRVQNESGIYLGVGWQPTRHFSVSYYADYAYFPWAKYQASTASSSFDNLLSLIYSPSAWSFSVHYRLKTQQKDDAEKKNLISHTTHRARLTAAYSPGKWHLKMRLDATLSSYKHQSNGWMVAAEGGLSPLSWLKVSASAGYFDTKDYESRIYSYEPGMRYDFSFPAFYGNGLRYTLLATASPLRNVTVSAKLATSDYFDRSTIGTGMQLISHSSATDMSLQLSWKF